MPNGHKDKAPVKPKAPVKSKGQRYRENQKDKGPREEKSNQEDEDSSKKRKRDSSQIGREQKRFKPNEEDSEVLDESVVPLKFANDLSPKYVKFAKNHLLGNSTSEGKKINKINKRAFDAISNSLKDCADKLVTVLRSEDNAEINLGADSKYGRILQRSVQAIRNKYGLLIDYVAEVEKVTSARDGLNNVKLNHPTEKWIENQNNANRETAKLAAIYLMSTNPVMKSTIDRVKNNQHRSDSISAIIEAYASEIADKGDINLIKSLAESRLRYSPITYGSDIYLAVNEADPSEIEEWGHFNTLIHEALHSVEHPGFASFLDTHIPPGLQDYIKEGIVDYLTSQVWGDVLRDSELVPEKGGKRITPSNKDFDEPLQITNAVKKKYHKDYFAYDDEADTVKALINNLNILKEDGEKRLISAYFGGNLGAFLPKLKDT